MVTADPTLTAPAHPVQLSIEHQEHYSRGLALLGCILFLGRMIALIPVLIALAIMNYICILIAFVMQIVVLFAGRYPAGAHRFLTGWMRWSSRTSAWFLGLTDRYPGFRWKP